MPLRSALIPAALTGALLAAGCASGPPEPVAADVAPPPSIREAPDLRLVRLDDAQAAELRVRTVTVAEAAWPVELQVPGTVEPSPEAFAVVSAPISGRVVAIYRHEGEAVGQGQAMLAIESLEFAEMVGAYLQARAEADFQARQVERLGPLAERRVVPRARLEEAEAGLARARALVQAEEARLGALGFGREALARYARDGARPVVPVAAPRGGVVHEHRVDLGQSVRAYDEVATVVGQQEVLVRGFVSPEDAALVRSGDAVRVTVANDTTRALRAAVTSVNPASDAESHAVAVNVRVATPGGELVPGQRVGLTITTAATQPSVRVPLSAIAYEGDAATVFVRHDGQTFERRTVTLGRTGPDDVEVTGGLAAGETVAASQVFSLKALGRSAQSTEE